MDRFNLRTPLVAGDTEGVLLPGGIEVNSGGVWEAKEAQRLVQ